MECRDSDDRNVAETGLCSDEDADEVMFRDVIEAEIDDEGPPASVVDPPR